jgi:thiamine-monophosphate kinase
VGEAELLRQLIGIARGATADEAALVVPSGDDAAVWRPPAGEEVVISQDAIVEGQDFRRSWLDPTTLGERALQVALSDLAGMGASPRLCLVTLCAAPGTQAGDLLALQVGLCDAAGRAGCPVAGGDVSAIEGPLVVDVVAVGGVAAGRALRRDRGRPGDWLVVTGQLGGAAAGLRVLLGEVEAPAALAEAWRGRQLRPAARLAEGLALLTAGVSCAGDLSDGLLVDLDRICAASRCGAELWLDRLPVEPGVKDVLGPDWPQAALGGGEDFELVAAVAPGLIDPLLEAWPAGLQPLRVVGRLDAAQGVRLRRCQGGEAAPLPAVTSRHFAIG